eukprot:2734206-Alexandrium_andersonii.AAC.1
MGASKQRAGCRFEECRLDSTHHRLALHVSSAAYVRQDYLHEASMASQPQGLPKPGDNGLWET